MKTAVLLKCLSILVLFSANAVASELVLKDGKVIEGILVRENEQSVIWKDGSGTYHNFSKEEIDLEKTTALKNEKPDPSSAKSKTGKKTKVFTAEDLTALREKYDLGQGSYGENSPLRLVSLTQPEKKEDQMEWFRAEVLEQNGPVLVEFWATWCGPCRKIAPVIDRITSSYEGKAKIVKIDVDKQKLIAAEYKIDAIPFMLFFKDGELKDHIIGAVSESAITSKLDQLL